MSERHCRWAGSDQPRMLRTHLRDCNTSGCPGCEPCPERHCGICGIEHVTVEGRGTDQTCAHCIGAVREDMAEIVKLSARMLPEAFHRGINSEAANLAGPTIDTADRIEAWGYRRMSGLMGRIPRLPDDDAQHPLWVLGTWETLVREHYGQPSESRLTIAAARRYLDGHLTRLAHDTEFAFEELATDVRRCRGHLEDVLHDGEREERGVRCPPCGRAFLVKSYGATEDDDRWHCPKCEQWWTERDYRDKVAGIYLGVAKALTASQLQDAYRIAPSTLRTWVERGQVVRRGRNALGQQLYDVEQAVAARDTKAATGA